MRYANPQGTNFDSKCENCVIACNYLRMKIIDFKEMKTGNRDFVLFNNHATANSIGGPGALSVSLFFFA
jgi:hypothetical protein